jgi:hypothetical protein
MDEIISFILLIFYFIFLGGGLLKSDIFESKHISDNIKNKNENIKV